LQTESFGALAKLLPIVSAPAEPGNASAASSKPTNAPYQALTHIG
jgi:hypothetical protein